MSHLGWKTSDCVTCGADKGEPCEAYCEARTNNCDCPTHRQGDAERAMQRIYRAVTNPDYDLHDVGEVANTEAIDMYGPYHTGGEGEG